MERHRKQISSQEGLTLISSLIAVVMIGMTSLSLVSMQVYQKKKILILKQKLVHIGLKSFITKVFYSGACSCHFDDEINTEAPDGSLFLNMSNTNALESISLESIRTGCHFDGNRNIIVKTNREVDSSGGLVVKSIVVKDLVATGTSDAYSGNLVISYTEPSQKFLLKPISIPLTLSIDTSSGTPEARPIQSCWQREDGNNSGAEEIENNSFSSNNMNCAQVTRSSHVHSESSLLSCGAQNQERKTGIGFSVGDANPTDNTNNTTYLGHASGQSASFSEGVFLGYKAGRSLSGLYNTAIGYLAGKSTQTGNRNNVLLGVNIGNSSKTSESTVIGTYAGQSSTNSAVFVGTKAGQHVREGILIGHEAGLSRYGIQSSDILIGNKVGRYTPSYGQNLVIGHQAAMRGNLVRAVGIGKSAGSEGISSSIVVGFQAGQRNKKHQNSFLGGQSGANVRDGNWNSFIGFQSGFNKRSGNSSTYIGTFAGFNDRYTYENLCLGWKSCYQIAGNHNTMLGAGSGQSNLGARNIFIGHGVGSLQSHRYLNDTFMIGTENHQEWLRGEISSVSTLLLNGTPITIQSSRALKKNISSTKSLKKYFQLILETPLFTYQYKDPNLQSDKVRMGIISEELPDDLQIKRKGKLSQPDWPSIYGIFAASIKWIYNSTLNLEKSMSTKMITFVDLLTSLKNDMKRMRKRRDKWVKNSYETKRSIKQSQENIRKIRDEIKHVKSNTEKKLGELMDDSLIMDP